MIDLRTSPLHGRAVVACVLALASTAISCSANPGIVKNASTILACPQDQITISEIHPQVRRASGCGRSEFYYNSYGVKWDNARDLKSRASFDLNCPTDRLQLSPLGGLSFGVSGCEKKAVYTLVRTTPSSFSWLMDSVSGEKATADEQAQHQETAE